MSEHTISSSSELAMYCVFSGVAGSFLRVRPNLGEGYEGCQPLNVKAPVGSGFERDEAPESYRE